MEAGLQAGPRGVRRRLQHLEVRGRDREADPHFHHLLPRLFSQKKPGIAGFNGIHFNFSRFSGSPSWSYGRAALATVGAGAGVGAGNVGVAAGAAPEAVGEAVGAALGAVGPAKP